MRLFVGLDVSLDKTTICVISEHGEIIREAEATSEPEVLSRWLYELDGRIAVVGLEAGPLSQWLHRGLMEAGLDAVLMETRQVKGALKAMSIKTDRRDAEGIARPSSSRLVPSGSLQICLCSGNSRCTRRSESHSTEYDRLGNVSERAAPELRPQGRRDLSRSSSRVRIRELADGNPMLETATAPMLRARETLRQELATLEKHVRQFAQDDPVCHRLMTMPGVGAVVALTFRAAVDDPTRFRSSKRIGPWVGLTPSRNQSGERDVSGGITKAGDVNLRRALCQAATVMMNRGRSTWLRTWGAQLAQRRGRKIAMAALARRIAVILHRIWIDGSVFQPDAAPKMI